MEFHYTSYRVTRDYRPYRFKGKVTTIFNLRFTISFVDMKQIFSFIFYSFTSFFLFFFKYERYNFFMHLLIVTNSSPIISKNIWKHFLCFNQDRIYLLNNRNLYKKIRSLVTTIYEIFQFDLTFIVGFKIIYRGSLKK